MTDTRPVRADEIEPSDIEPSDIVVTLARPDQYRALGELTHAAYAHDYPVHDSYAWQLLHPEERVDEYDIYVAEDAATNELLGTISVLRPGADHEGRLNEGELYFRLLGVSPTARRRGVGARLTTFTYELARTRGQHTIVLNSGPQMLGAHALYRTLGFVHDSDRDITIVESGKEFTVLTFTLSLSEIPGRT
jgi:ribosomal protein S18 acetylase RimI-like enzyme